MSWLIQTMCAPKLISSLVQCNSEWYKVMNKFKCRMINTRTVSNMVCNYCIQYLTGRRADMANGRKHLEERENIRLQNFGRNHELLWKECVGNVWNNRPFILLRSDVFHILYFLIIPVLFFSYNTHTCIFYWFIYLFIHLFMYLVTYLLLFVYLLTYVIYRLIDRLLIDWLIVMLQWILHIKVKRSRYTPWKLLGGEDV
jgi:hypothetical protein